MTSMGIPRKIFRNRCIPWGKVIPTTCYNLWFTPLGTYLLSYEERTGRPMHLQISFLILDYAAQALMWQDISWDLGTIRNLTINRLRLPLYKINMIFSLFLTFSQEICLLEKTSEKNFLKLLGSNLTR